jgi:hypothetical protein
MLCPSYLCNKQEPDPGHMPPSSTCHSSLSPGWEDTGRMDRREPQSGKVNPWIVSRATQPCALRVALGHLQGPPCVTCSELQSPEVTKLTTSEVFQGFWALLPFSKWSNSHFIKLAIINCAIWWLLGYSTTVTWSNTTHSLLFLRCWMKFFFVLLLYWGTLWYLQKFYSVS